MKKSMLTMALLLLSALAFAGGQRGGSGEAKQVATIRWLGVQHAWTNTITQYLPEFEAATGIKVQFESYTEEQLSNKLAVESTAKSRTMDVYNFRPLQEILLFAKNGWAAALDDFYKNDAEYDIADFGPAALASVTVDGKVFAIPLIVEAEVLYYNKKLLAEKGVGVPATQAELYEAAGKLTDKNRGIYGIVIRGARSAAVTQFSGYLFSNGGDFITNGRAGLTSPAAIKSFKLYGDLLRNFGPPGVLNMAWPQAAELFSQGKVAMYTDASSLYNSAVGEIAADIGTALFPAGDVGSKPYNICSWGLGIGINSEKKDAAWTLIKWLTSKEMMGRTQALGNSMSRTSAWENPENNKSFPADFIDVMRRSGAIGIPYDRPVIARVQEARDVIGTVIVASINGEDVEGAARDAQVKFQDIIDHDSQ